MLKNLSPMPVGSVGCSFAVWMVGASDCAPASASASSISSLSTTTPPVAIAAWSRLSANYQESPTGFPAGNCWWSTLAADAPKRRVSDWWVDRHKQTRLFVLPLLAIVQLWVRGAPEQEVGRLSASQNAKIRKGLREALMSSHATLAKACGK